MDWQDLEYLLRKTYHQSRAYSAPLINRENGLNLSFNGLLSKTSAESLKYHRKILQIANDIYKTADKENERIVIGDVIENYSEEYILMLAKELKFPSVTGSKIVPKPTNQKLMDNFMETLTENFNQKVNLESIQNTVDMADSALAAIHDILKGSSNNTSNGDSDDVICLTQSICNNLISKSESNENIHMEIVEDEQKPANPFMTAKQALAKNIGQRSLGQSSNSNNNNNNNNTNSSYNPSMQARKLLGAKRRFVDPKSNEPGSNSGYRDEGRDINTEFSYYNMNKAPASNSTASNNKPQKPISYNSNNNNNAATPEEPIDERLANIDPRLIEMIRNEIMHRVDNITWDSIAGLEHAKNSIKEIVVWPMLRPDIFKGLRGPPKGLLLFGPPGTGKTMIGKCIASQAKATFFSISASSLTSKWVGEGEKMVRALFAVARCSQPAVIFIDEIDSLLTQRTDGEIEASRRIKTEFLVQFDGAGTNSEDRILVIGATNRPQEIDEAARRRLLKRLYIPLPESEARATIIRNLLSNQSHGLTEEDIKYICERTEGYSGSDMDGLCREAAIGPIRSISDILNISTNDVRPISRQDFEEALTQVRASVSNQDLELYLDWNQKFGSVSKT